MSSRRGDDLNLSLTGSQISAISSRPGSARPSSAKSNRSNAAVDAKQKNTASKKVENAKTTGGGAQGRHESTGSGGPASHRSVASSRPSSRAGSATPGGKTQEDFLAFFENPTKIKNPSFSSSRPTHSSSKKPSANAIKVLPGGDSKSKKPAWASRPPVDPSSARSDAPHNIFQPESARSSNDDDVDCQARLMDDFDQSLSQSITKLHTLQSQLSGVNRESGMSAEPSSALNTNRSNSTIQSSHGTAAEATRGAGSSIDDFIQGIMENTGPKTNFWASARQDPPTPPSPLHSPTHDRTTKSKGGQSPVANNMLSRGQAQKAKASLSSMENSFQNIKHKAPVNQVNAAPGAPGAYFNQNGNNKTRWAGAHNTSHNTSHTKASQHKASPSNKLSEQKVLKDCVNDLTNAAILIQRWYRRHHGRRLAGQAAMRRMLADKREEHAARLKESVSVGESEEKKAEDRKRAREEKAKEARLQAIKDLQKKREERKNEVKKVAEEEVKFLQASGRITKGTSAGGAKKKTSVGKDSKNSLGQKGDGRLSRQHSSIDKAETSTGYSDGDKTPTPSAADGGSEVRQSGGGQGSTHTDAKASTTLDDLYSTLKKLEEEENFLSARAPASKTSWLDELEKSAEDGGLGSNLTMENLQKLNRSKDTLAQSGSLSQGKLQTIISFLDEVHVTDRLSEIDTEISRMNEELERPALLTPSAQELMSMDQARAAASEVTNTVLSQRLELDEKQRSVTMLQRALNQQRELTVRHARETDKEMKARLEVQKQEYESAIARHLGFIDQLIDDKKSMSDKCETLVGELKSVDRKYQDKMKSIVDNHAVEMTKLKEVHSAAEKLRREKWIEDKTKKIKEMTVKGLEPEIQRLIAKHKSDVKKMRQIHEAELLESDERAAGKYVKMTEELRDTLAQEKEAACEREREAATHRYEKDLQREEQAYQQQRRRLYQEVQEEKDRVAASSSRQRGELEKLQRQLEDNHRHALESMKEELDAARQEQERRHQAEVKGLTERLKLEKESWEENYMKRHDTWLVQKERELKEAIKKDRDKEIELVIERLEEDASTTREEAERTSEVKVRRMRDKLEKETTELEQSERKALQRLNQIKAQMTEVEGENERLKVIVRQKDLEITDNKKLLEKMNSERAHVSDIIRQEFADRIVTTDEENKRIKHEVSEVRARQRLDQEKAAAAMEDLRRAKDGEMEEVHHRVKQAILKKEEVVSQLRQQYQAATKRADHLEGLLEQQRKHILAKK